MKSIDIDSTRWRGSVFTVFFLYWFTGLPSLTGFTKFTSLLIPGLLPGLPGVITAVRGTGVPSSESPLSLNTHPNAATHSETHTMNQPHMKADEPHTHKLFLVVLLFLPPLIMVEYGG